MKFLHIADLHLGKQLNDVSLMEDQEDVLRQIISIARNSAVDAVLIAGDVYQKAAPPAEAMALFDRFVSELVKSSIRVFVISGNHDSAQRVSYFSSLLQSSGVYVTAQFTGTLQSVTLKDPYGDITIHMLPFIKPAQVRRYFPEEKASSSQDAVAAVLRRSPIDSTQRNVLICHQFVTGSETCDSEERAVGGLDNVDAELFDAFDYVAMGHIHKPQRLLRDTLRYAGSPLKYSFSETAHRKSVTLIDMREKGDVAIQTVLLQPLHDLRLIQGNMADIMGMPYSEDYVWITVTDELVPPDARVTISTVFPNMLKFSVSNSRTRYDVDVIARETLENKDLPELFRDFYRLQNNDQPPSEAHMKALEKVLMELEDELHEAR